MIGIKQCTTRRFGYCGNDFAAAKNLTDPVLDELEKLGMQVGRWLSRNGYLGAFGIDALCHDGLVYLTEVNPRFQGSSRVTAELDAALGLSDIFLHHAASFLGLSPPPQQPLRELTRATPARAHVVCHNLLSVPAEVTSEGVRLGLPPHDVLPAAGETVDPDAVLGVVHFDASVTTDGSDILPHAQAMLDAVIRAHYGLDLSRLAEPRADSS
ncbi:MAG: ATP-grasp domain-containing protein [Gemmatimonadetes bacterium]|nr:ATP-grasp domain-containing protein [Gemmatimonadota bacterium]